MEDITPYVNWLAVLVASIAYFMLGAVWYSALFSKAWIRYQGIDVNDPELRKGTAIIMTLSLVLMVVTVIALAIIVGKLGYSEPLSGVKLGLLTGIGFAATAVSIGYLYTKKPLGLHLVDGGYHVAGHVIAAVILCLFN